MRYFRLATSIANFLLSLTSLSANSDIFELRIFENIGDAVEISIISQVQTETCGSFGLAIDLHLKFATSYIPERIDSLSKARYLFRQLANWS